MSKPSSEILISKLQRAKIISNVQKRKWTPKKLNQFIQDIEDEIALSEESMQRRLSDLNRYKKSREELIRKHNEAEKRYSIKVKQAERRLKIAQNNLGLFKVFASSKAKERVAVCERELRGITHDDEGREKTGTLMPDTSVYDILINGKCKTVGDKKVTGAYYYNHLRRTVAKGKVKLAAAKKLIPSMNKDVKIKQLQARATTKEKAIRNMAVAVNKGIKEEQLKKLKKCPYCGNTMPENMHADHIYPVSKGGRSTEQNLVCVCAACNLKKRDKTLTKFILDEGLNRDYIESSLVLLGKDF